MIMPWSSFKLNMVIWLKSTRVSLRIRSPSSIKWLRILEICQMVITRLSLTKRRSLSKRLTSKFGKEILLNKLGFLWILRSPRSSLRVKSISKIESFLVKKSKSLSFNKSWRMPRSSCKNSERPMLIWINRSSTWSSRSKTLRPRDSED
jgi:hypothetical protein